MNQKKYGHNTIVGQKGINLIEKIVLEMGYVWHPTNLDAGIDGIIEIRNTTTEEATNFVIQVQSKATEQKFTAETDSTFEYYCDERDLDYWLKGNAPVILICSNVEKQTAYWVMIKEYFKDPAKLKSRKITFKKSENLFSKESKSQLWDLAVPERSGLYLSPPPITETVYLNLLKLTNFPDTIYFAKTKYRKPKELWKKLNELADKKGINKSWLLHDSQIYSFNDLNKEPWRKILGKSKVTKVKTTVWSLSNDINIKRNFVAILKATFETFVFHKNILHCRFDPVDLYYFRPILDENKKPKKIQADYKRLGRNSFQTVCNSYTRKSDPTIISYYRYLAFEINFFRFDNNWYLEITPTYFFTHDGFKLHLYYESKLKGKKGLDTAETVFSEALFWSYILTKNDGMFDKSIIGFEPMISFQIDNGINEKEWLRKEDIEKLDEMNTEQNLFTDEY